MTKTPRMIILLELGSGAALVLALVGTKIMNPAAITVNQVVGLGIIFMACSLASVIYTVRNSQDED